MPSRLALSLLLTILLTHATPTRAQQYTLAPSIPLAGSGAWDYLTADSAARRLYVSHTSDVNVLDLDTLKPVGALSGFGYIHDILIATPTLGFLSDGVANQLVVFNPTTLKILQKIPTPADPNSLAYDPLTRRLFIGSRPTRSLIVFNVDTFKIEATLPLDGQPRFSAADGHGLIFLAIDDRSEILRIDARTLKITDTWPTAPCRSPSSLVYSPSTLRLFTPCGNRLLAVLDALSGKLVATAPIGAGPDQAAYDETRRLFFSSNNDGTLTIVSGPKGDQSGTDKFNVVQNVATEPGARTMALDTVTHNVFISSAQLGPPPAPTPDNPKPTGHPTSLPGTFHLLVVKPALECDPTPATPCAASLQPPPPLK
jgi:hypothetical protein